MNQYICTCPAGFSGIRCEINIDECATEPCRNGALCIDGINQFYCQCASGYTGSLCEIDFNECSSSPCQNNGSCFNGRNQFLCVCPQDFSGTRCEINTNYCVNNPCQNGGICSNGNGQYFCQCPIGTSGQRCEIIINYCTSNPCQNGGSCTNDYTNGRYICKCTEFWKGSDCSSVVKCIDQPCLNQGFCLPFSLYYPYGFSCYCQQYYTGNVCELSLNPCDQTPCLNGASCQVTSAGMFQCLCASGYSGQFCELVLNSCQSDQCLNGGTCINNQFAQTSCICREGFTGFRCQINIDECQSSPCLNGGSCIDGINSFSCRCPNGYNGINCGVNIDECQSTPCLNGGTCIDGINQFNCACRQGYIGERCQTTDYCGSKPCPVCSSSLDFEATILVRLNYTNSFFFGNTAVFVNQIYNCSGAMFDQYSIVTSAHCLPDSIEYNYEGKVYTLPISQLPDDMILPMYTVFYKNRSFKIRKIVRNNQYRQNDLAIVFLNKTDQVNFEVACLPKQDNDGISDTSYEYGSLVNYQKQQTSTSLFGYTLRSLTIFFNADSQQCKKDAICSSNFFRFNFLDFFWIQSLIMKYFRFLCWRRTVCIT
jgi:hypothetical protein